jgi:hypothetical protein
MWPIKIVFDHVGCTNLRLHLAGMGKGYKWVSVEREALRFPLNTAAWMFVATGNHLVVK